MNELEFIDDIEAETQRDLRAARRELTSTVASVIRSHPRSALATGLAGGTAAGWIAARPQAQRRSRSSLTRRTLATAARAAIGALTMGLA